MERNAVHMSVKEAYSYLDYMALLPLKEVIQLYVVISM